MRYKYSENTNEITAMYFDTETYGEYIGMEQEGVMLKIPTSLLKSSLDGSDKDYIVFSTSPSTVPTAEGSIYWNEDEQTLSVIKSTGSTEIGQEIDPLCYALEDISEGALVMYNGTVTSDEKLVVKNAVLDGTYPTSYVIGIATEDASFRGNFRVTMLGKVHNIDTTGTYIDEDETVWQDWSEGDILYGNPAKVGGLTNVEPSSPNPIIKVATIINSDTSGTMMVYPCIVPTLLGLEDVSSDVEPDTDNQILAWDNTNEVWKVSDELIEAKSEIADLQAQIDGKVYGIQIDHSTGDVARTGDAVGMSFGSPDGTQAITSDFDNVFPYSDIYTLKIDSEGVKEISK